MAAIFTALRLAVLSYEELRGRTFTGGLTIAPSVVVFGFPYLDTLKVNRNHLFARKHSATTECTSPYCR
jgi:hypothetical protein